MQYRQSESGKVYRQSARGNEVLTPYGWMLAAFLCGQRGWEIIVQMTTPVGINPAWPA
jgi:hypothetical protein